MARICSGEGTNGALAITSKRVEPIQEQLGLRLESQRAAVDVLVIEAVERPAPN